MKTTFVVALLVLIGWSAPSFGQVTGTSLIGNYVVTGTEPDGKPFDGPGPLAITMDKSGALELKWDGGKYVGIGQVLGNQVVVASLAERRLVIGIMNVKPNGSLEGRYWRRTDPGTKGTEIWTKK